MKIIIPISRDRYMTAIFKIFVNATAILLLLAAALSAQTTDKPANSDKTDTKVLEESVKRIDEKIADNKAEIKDELDDKFVELNTRMYIYIGFVVAIIGFIGFFLNFFAKKTIRSWVEEKINEIAKEELDDRLEPIYIKYKDERTKELEERWESRLKGIEEMKKTLKKIEDRQTIPAKEMEQTLKSLEEVKQEKDFSANDWFFKAYNEAQKGNHEKAISYYSETIKLNPNYEFAFINRGVSYYELKTYEMAIQDYDKGIELDPEMADAYNNRGNTYSTLKEYERALADYAKAIELDPDMADAYNNRGLTHSNFKEYEKALVDYAKALELDPENIDVYENMAESLILMGKYDLAIGKTEKAMTRTIEAKEKAILLYLKCIAQKLIRKDTKEAEAELEEILKEDIGITWSFDDIEEWIIAADIPEEARKFIEEKTDLLKRKIK
jgi:tetratricopeptide (TPR) repeat protein